MKPVVIGDMTLYCGDCLEIIPDIIERINSVIMDPPYGIRHKTGHRNANTPWHGEIEGDRDSCLRDGALEKLKGKSALVFGSRKIKEPVGTRMILTWDKGPALGMGDLALPWKPSTEEIYVIGREFVGPRDEGSVLYCPPVQSMAKNGRLHPNEKPIDLLKRLIRKMPGLTILDPFMGSGPAAIACIRLGRMFIGIEKDRHYFNITCRRVRYEYAQLKLFPPAPARVIPVQLELDA